MTTTHTQGQAAATRTPTTSLGRSIVRVLTTHRPQGDRQALPDHFLRWFLIGGLMAMLIRSELAFPGQQVVNDEIYNQLFTMHGTIMLLLFATPLFFGFANVIMPLQIGSPDVAFPRLNMFSYWLFLFGGLIAGAGFLTPRARPTSAGPPTPRSPTRSAAPGSAVTCGSWACGWPAWAPSSARSTSSPRSSACARPA